MTKHTERMTYKEAEVLLEPLFSRMAVEAANGDIGEAANICQAMRTKSTVEVVNVLNYLLTMRPPEENGLSLTGIETASLIDDSWVDTFAMNVADFCTANMLTEMHATCNGEEVVVDKHRTSCMSDDYVYEDYLNAFLLQHKQGTVLTVGYSTLTEMGKQHITVIVDGALYRFVM